MEIPNPQFSAGDVVEPTSDAAIKPKSRVGRVESRSWTEFRDQPAYWRYTIRWPEGGTSSEDDKHLQKADPIGCDLKVVVGGVPAKIDTTTTATVAEVVEQALLASGAATHEGVIEWELRTEDGRQLTHLVGDAGLVDGETVLYLDPEAGGGGADDLQRQAEESGQVWPEGSPERRLIERGGKEAVMRELDEANRRDQLRYVEGWQGTPPAEGTRRALIRDTLRGFLIDVAGKEMPGGVDGMALAMADSVEAALLKIDIGADPTGEVSPASTAMDVLDGLRIPRTEEGRIYDIGQRVTMAADELVERRRNEVEIGNLLDLVSIGRSMEEIGESPQRTLTLLERVDILAKRYLNQKPLPPEPIHPGPAPEGKVKPGTTELRIVLEDVSDPEGPPEYRFIELEDQDGAGVGAFPIRSSERPPFKEIVIPYGRDDRWLSEVVYQAVGAATRPMLEDNPEYVFPAERVRDAVAALLEEFGIPRACHDCQEEQLEHGYASAAPPTDNSTPPDEFDCASLACQRLFERLTDGPIPNPAELARTIDILRHGTGR